MVTTNELIKNRAEDLQVKLEVLSTKLDAQTATNLENINAATAAIDVKIVALTANNVENQNLNPNADL